MRRRDRQQLYHQYRYRWFRSFAQCNPATGISSYCVLYLLVHIGQLKSRPEIDSQLVLFRKVSYCG